MVDRSGGHLAHDAFRFVGLCGHDDDGDVGFRRDRLDPLEHLVAVGYRHHDVEHDELDVFFLDLLDSLFATGGLDDLMAGHGEGGPHQGTDGRLVVDDQDLAHTKPLP